MNTETAVLTEGDVYRWSYRESGDNGAWGRYHCCSRIAIVNKGRLRDTYWQIGGSFPHDGRSFGPEDLSKLNLTRLGNLIELEKVGEYNDEYYDNDDIVNLNHANSTRGNFYIRKGAKRSAAKMLESAKRRLEKAESDARSAAFRRSELREAIRRIISGDTDLHL